MNSEKIDIYLTDYLSNKKRLDIANLHTSPPCDNININEIVIFNYAYIINPSYSIPDNKGGTFYSYVVPRIGDMVSDINVSLNGVKYSAKDVVKNETLKIKLIYSIGGILYNPDEMSDFLFICARFYEFKIIVTFEEFPSIHDVIELNFIYYRMNKQDVEFLTDCNKRIFLGNNVYENDKLDKLN